jgi:hypothetical protein
MATTTYYILYLNSEVKEDRWAHLHRFLHPGSADQIGWISILCTNLDLTHGVYLSCKAKNYSGTGPKTIQLRYGLVDSIVEVASHSIPPGFLSSNEIQTQQLDQ